MSGQVHNRRMPNKSWGITILFAALSAAAPFINEPLEKYFGVTLTENEINHLLTMFLGTAAIGGVNAAHKRREKRKAGIVGTPDDGYRLAHAYGHAYGAATAPAPDQSGTGKGILDPATGSVLPGSHLGDDDFDDDDDEIPPPKDGGN